MSQAVRKAVRKAFENIARESYIDEGKAEGKAGSIIQVLNHRFQTVPKSVEKKVYAVKNVDQLVQLTGQAVSCQSIAEFADSLKSQE